MSAPDQPQLPGMPERPDLPPASAAIVLLAVTVSSRGQIDRAVRDLCREALLVHVADAVRGWNEAGDEPRRIKLIGVGSEVVAEYARPGHYEAAREHAYRSALLAAPVRLDDPDDDTAEDDARRWLAEHEASERPPFIVDTPDVSTYAPEDDALQGQGYFDTEHERHGHAD
jgi:hypothetical protein